MNEYRVSIHGNENELQLKIQQKRNSGWTTIEKTTNPIKIKKYIKAFVPEIVTCKEKNSNLYCMLKDEMMITVYDYPTLKENKLLKPIFQKNELLRKKIHNRKRLIYTGLLLSLGAMGIAGGINTYNKKKEEVKQEKSLENELEQDLLETIEQKSLEQQEVLIAKQLIEESIKKIKQKRTDQLTSYLTNIGENKENIKLCYVQENYKASIQKYATIIGIDEAIMECIIAQETSLDNNMEINSGGAIGPAQIQYNHHINDEKTIYNVITGEKETFTVTDEMLKSIDGNIKVCAAVLQDQLIRYNGNIFLAIQAYNFGQGAMNKILRKTEENTGYTKEDFIKEPYNLTWLEYVLEYSNEKESETGNKYGDPEYLQKIFGFYYKDEIITLYNQYPYQENETMTTTENVISLTEKNKSRN